LRKAVRGPLWEDQEVFPKLRQTLAVLAMIAAAATLAACGERTEITFDHPAIDEAEDPHAAIAVIDDWSGRLSEGDTAGAAELFAIPSVAVNGDLPLHLTSRDDALAFNRSLPCGAKLVKARPAGDLIAATFRLTDRPGGACGSGVGHLARTAFQIKDGHIIQWRRLPDPEALRPRGEVV
jgi:hypothetical protein